LGGATRRGRAERAERKHEERGQPQGQRKAL
jgi:hypothetical protein